MGQPITISAYGTGAKPVISGLTTLSNWVSVGNGVWESYNSTLGSSVNTVLLNNVSQQIGRYPNSDAPNKGYLIYEAHGYFLYSIGITTDIVVFVALL